MIVQKMWTKYCVHNTVKNPIKTKIITATALFAAGDLTCQKLIEKKSKIDLNRLLSQSLLVAVWLSPSCQFFQAFVAPKLVLNIGATFKYKRLSENVFRGLSHWAVMTPLHGVTFLYASGFLRNWEMSRKQGSENLKSKWRTFLQGSASFWPAISVLGYHMFDYHLRNPFFNMMSFLFSIGLSYINNNDFKP